MSKRHLSEEDIKARYITPAITNAGQPRRPLSDSLFVRRRRPRRARPERPCAGLRLS